MKQIDLVLCAIEQGATIVNQKYLGDVLCLASRGSLSRAEMERLVLPSGKMVFIF